MFDDSDFELDDEVVNAVLDKISSQNPHNSPIVTVQKRVCADETASKNTGKRIRTDARISFDKEQKGLDDISKYFESPAKKDEGTATTIANPIDFESSPPLSGNKQCILAKRNSFSNKNVPRKVVQRKFPGPAGLLPEKMDKDVLVKDKNEDDLFKGTQSVEPMICSQYSERLFDNLPWQKMMEDFDCDKIDNQSLPDKYNIEWIKVKSQSQKLVNQKAPFLAAVVHNVEHVNKKTTGTTVTLKDETGEIQGTIIYDLYKEYDTDLVVGSVVILKQFGVLSAGSDPVLTITDKNLVRIYRLEHESVSCKDDTQEKSSDFTQKFAYLETPRFDSSQKVRVINVQSLMPKDIIANIQEIRNFNKRDTFSDEALSTFLDNFSRNFEQKQMNLNSSTLPVPKMVTSANINNFQRNSSSSNVNLSNNLNSSMNASVSINANVSRSPRTTTQVPVAPKTSMSENRPSNKTQRFQFKAIVNKENRVSTMSATNSSMQQSKGLGDGPKVQPGLSRDGSKTDVRRANVLRAAGSVNTNDAKCSQVSVETDNLEERKMVENMFEGVDAELLFDDF